MSGLTKIRDSDINYNPPLKLLRKVGENEIVLGGGNLSTFADVAEDVTISDINNSNVNVINEITDNHLVDDQNGILKFGIPCETGKLLNPKSLKVILDVSIVVKESNTTRALKIDDGIVPTQGLNLVNHLNIFLNGKNLVDNVNRRENEPLLRNLQILNKYGQTQSVNFISELNRIYKSNCFFHPNWRNVADINSGEFKIYKDSKTNPPTEYFNLEKPKEDIRSYSHYLNIQNTKIINGAGAGNGRFQIILDFENSGILNTTEILPKIIDTFDIEFFFQKPKDVFSRAYKTIASKAIDNLQIQIHKGYYQHQQFLPETELLEVIQSLMGNISNDKKNEKATIIRPSFYGKKIEYYDPKIVSKGSLSMNYRMEGIKIPERLYVSIRYNKSLTTDLQHTYQLIFPKIKKIYITAPQNSLNIFQSKIDSPWKDLCENIYDSSTYSSANINLQLATDQHLQTLFLNDIAKIHGKSELDNELFLTKSQFWLDNAVIERSFSLVSENKNWLKSPITTTNLYVQIEFYEGVKEELRFDFIGESKSIIIIDPDGFATNLRQNQGTSSATGFEITKQNLKRKNFE